MKTLLKTIHSAFKRGKMTEENVAGVILKEKLAFKNNVDKFNFYI